MVKRLYLDGCSMVRGPGLLEEETLKELFHEVGGYSVTDNSRLGKSNLAIVMDAYKNFSNHDTFVLGFTYASRFYIQYQEENLDFFTGFHGRGLNLSDNNNSANLEKEFLEVYKYFYSTYGPPFSDNLSDTIIDGLLSFLSTHGKKVVAFSWEPRNTITKLEYPYIGPSHRLADGHLNAQGTLYLFNLLQRLINE